MKKTFKSQDMTFQENIIRTGKIEIHDKTKLISTRPDMTTHDEEKNETRQRMDKK